MRTECVHSLSQSVQKSRLISTCVDIITIKSLPECCLPLLCAENVRSRLSPLFKDHALSYDEMVNKYEVFVGSKATHYRDLLKPNHRLRNYIDVKLGEFFVLHVLMRIRKFLASTHTRIC